jgi:hypothetical protein
MTIVRDNPVSVAEKHTTAVQRRRTTVRTINIVVLWMSHQRNFGGAVGHSCLGGDIYTQLKPRDPRFAELVTHAKAISHWMSGGRGAGATLVS